MSTVEKKFVLKHIFKNVSKAEENKRYYSETEEHFNIPWSIYFVRTAANFTVFLFCDKSLEGAPWSTQAECQMTIKSDKVEDAIRKSTFNFGNFNNNTYNSWGWPKCLTWSELQKDYVTDDRIVVEASVTLSDMNGIDKKVTKLRSFDESMKEFSDVVLVVDGEMCYVLKQFLAIHSPFFKSLFYNGFQEKGKSEVELCGIKSTVFQKYLEVLYGDSAIDDDTVEDIYALADMYDTQIVVQKCETFLCKESKKPLKKRFELAKKFGIEKLRDKCISDVKTTDELHAALPVNIREMDQSTATALLEKFYLLY